MLRTIYLLAFACLICLPSSIAQRSPTETSAIRDLVQTTLITPGNPPFHLKAIITEDHETSPYGEVEIYWKAPNQYKRVIRSRDFNQVRIVHGHKVSEENSTNYFPLQLHTFVTAMVDPAPILEAVRQGDSVRTRSNGLAVQRDLYCVANPKVCETGIENVKETVAASGHSVTFEKYEPFHGRQVARELTNAPRLGEDRVTLRVVELEDLQRKDRGEIALPSKKSGGLNRSMQHRLEVYSRGFQSPKFFAVVDSSAALLC